MAPGIACERRRICGCRFSPLKSNEEKRQPEIRLRSQAKRAKYWAQKARTGMPATPFPLPTPHRKFWKQADAISSLFRDNFFKNLTSKMTHILSIF